MCWKRLYRLYHSIYRRQLRVGGECRKLLTFIGAVAGSKGNEGLLVGGQGCRVRVGGVLWRDQEFKFCGECWDTWLDAACWWELSKASSGERLCVQKQEKGIIEESEESNSSWARALRALKEDTEAGLEWKGQGELEALASICLDSCSNIYLDASSMEREWDSATSTSLIPSIS